MKRFSLLMALLVCVTVSGVYAAWSYAGTTDIVDGYAEIKATIAEATTEGANGTYKVESNLVLVVDEGEGKKATLKFDSNNNSEVFLKVTFTPNLQLATPEIIENGVESEVYFTTSATMEYDGRSIFKFANPGNDILDNEIQWTKEGNNFVYEMDLAAIKEAIELNGDFVLATKAEHDNFRSALGGNIVVRVTDGEIN